MKVVFLSGALLLFFTMAHAQSNVHYGLKAGINISNVPASAGNGYNAKAGFNAGGLAHIHLNKTWALQPEIMYSGQGGKSGSQTLKLDYINVPVQLQYMFNKGFRLQTGPQIGFLAAANVQTGDVKSDVKSSFKPVDFSWSFGTGYLSESGLGIDARYNLGLTKINDGGSVNYNNSVFQLGLFYQFMHHH